MSAGTRTAGEGRAAGKSAQVRATEKGAIFHKPAISPPPLSWRESWQPGTRLKSPSMLSWELSSVHLGHTEEPDLDIAVWNKFHTRFA